MGVAETQFLFLWQREGALQESIAVYPRGSTDRTRQDITRRDHLVWFAGCREGDETYAVGKRLLQSFPDYEGQKRFPHPTRSGEREQPHLWTG